MQKSIDAWPTTRRAPDLASITAALTMVAEHANDGPLADAQSDHVALIANTIWAHHA
jgi:hypothetical protein